MLQKRVKYMIKALKLLVVSGLLLFSGGLVYAAPQDTMPAIDLGDTIYHPTLGYNGMVVSQTYDASEAGLLVMKQGGNAIDAAVATAFALAVTYPQAGNIGGGGFMMIYLAEEERVIAVDYREMAPALAHRDMFLDENGAVDNAKARWSSSASGVPGSVAGLLYAQEKYGSLSLKKVMAPAIKLAEDGFVLSRYVAGSIDDYKRRLFRSPASKQYFFKPDGSSYQAGELLIQKDLAKTLKRIAKKGRDGFYKGAVADKIVATMKATGGLINHDDLIGYKVVEREVFSQTYNGYDVFSMPPPSSGGVHLLQLLNILEGYDLQAMGHNSAQYVHTLTEAMKYVYADRSKYLGDPDFFDVPVAALTDKKYAAHIRDKIKNDRATPSLDISPEPKLPFESHQTTHLSTADKAGNVVSNTTTLNYTYGNGYAVAGAGFVMNNEMDDFSAKPGSPNVYGLLGGVANSIAPKKRPLSSMTPTIVLKDGKPYIATGSPGGSRIITTVLQNVLNMLTFDMNPMEANAAPRMHHQWYPDMIKIEPGFNRDSLDKLRSMGHNIPLKQGATYNDMLGSEQTIMLKDGVLLGAADPRYGNAHAAGY